MLNDWWRRPDIVIQSGLVSRSSPKYPIMRLAVH